MIVGEPQVLQRDVHVRERHRQRPCRCAGVAVLSHQRERGGAIRRDAGGERHPHERAGRETHPLAQGRHRVEDGADGAGQRPAVERQRIGGRSAAAEEAGAIGFPLDGAAQAPVDAEHVERERGRVVGGRAAGG